MNWPEWSWLNCRHWFASLRMVPFIHSNCVTRLSDQWMQCLRSAFVRMQFSADLTLVHWVNVNGFTINHGTVCLLTVRWSQNDQSTLAEPSRNILGRRALSQSASRPTSSKWRPSLTVCLWCQLGDETSIWFVRQFNFAANLARLRLHSA